MLLARHNRVAAVCALMIVTVLSLGWTACVERREVARPQSDLDRLVSWMAGSFSSQQQAEADSAFLDIRLDMLPIWTGRTDGRWMYVEQAAANSLEQPYRQRIYHLTRRNDSTFSSAVYEFAEPLRFAGAWRTPDLFDALTPDSLEVREGCAIILHPVGDTAFAGRTIDGDCLSEHRGASHATSEVVITADYLSSWDRGWDSAGVQVWGAESGGYMFRKLSEE
jgi:hypothetical protein